MIKSLFVPSVLDLFLQERFSAEAETWYAAKQAALRQAYERDKPPFDLDKACEAALAELHSFIEVRYRMRCITPSAYQGLTFGINSCCISANLNPLTGYVLDPVHGLNNHEYIESTIKTLLAEQVGECCKPSAASLTFSKVRTGMARFFHLLWNGTGNE